MSRKEKSRGLHPGNSAGHYSFRGVCSDEEEDATCRSDLDDEGDDDDRCDVDGNDDGIHSGASDGSGYHSSGQGIEDGEPEEGCESALRLVHVGPSLVRAGIEQWLKGLSRFLDPRRLRLVECVVTMPENFDRKLAAELPVRVTLGGSEAVQRVAQECDVFLFSGTFRRSAGGWRIAGRS